MQATPISFKPILFTGHIEIELKSSKIILWRKQQATPCTLIRVQQYSFLLTIMTLDVGRKKIYAPIVFGLTPLKTYKAIRRFLAWN